MPERKTRTIILYLSFGDLCLDLLYMHKMIYRQGIAYSIQKN